MRIATGCYGRERSFMFAPLRAQPDVVSCPSMRPVALTIAGVSGVLLRWRLAALIRTSIATPRPSSDGFRHAAFDRLLQQRPAGVDTSNVFPVGT